MKTTMTKLRMRKIVTGLCYILLFLAGMKSAVVYGGFVSVKNDLGVSVLLTNEGYAYGYWIAPGGSVRAPMQNYSGAWWVMNTNYDLLNTFDTDGAIWLDEYNLEGQLYFGPSGVQFDMNIIEEPVNYLPNFMLGWVTAVVMGLGSVGIRMLAAAGKTTTTEL